MGLTIKEKVMKAWAQDLKVVVYFAMDSELSGYVSEWVSHAFEIRDTVRYTEKGLRRFYYHDITDIRFVDEVEDDTTLETIDGVRKWRGSQRGLVKSAIEMAIISGVEIFVKYKHSQERPVVRNAGTVQTRNEREFGLLVEGIGIIAIAYTDVILIGYDAGNKEPDPPEPERWEYNPENGCVHRVGENLPPSLFKIGYGTDEDMRLAAKAPQMRDALKMVRDKAASVAQYGGDTVLSFDGDEWQIILDALEKAGG